MTISIENKRLSIGERACPVADLSVAGTLMLAFGLLGWVAAARVAPGHRGCSPGMTPEASTHLPPHFALQATS